MGEIDFSTPEEREAKAAADQKAARFRKDQADADLREVVSTESGRGFYWRLMSEAGVFRTPFNANGNIAAFNMGRQDFGITLLSELMRVAPDQFLVMREEANARASKESKTK